MSNSPPLYKYLKTTAKYGNILAQNNIKTLQDFLQYYPRAYEDRATIRTLSQIDFEGGTQTVKGRIVKKAQFTTPRGRRVTQVHFVDENERSGLLTFFQGAYVLKDVYTNKWYYIVGKPRLNYGKIEFSHPDIIAGEQPIDSSYNFGRIYPVYPELMGIKAGWFARKMFDVISLGGYSIEESLPDDFLEKYGLVKKEDLGKMMHFPASLEEVDLAKKRIFFEKMLRIQLVSLSNKNEYQHVTPQHEEYRERIKKFLGTLPYELTGAQKRSIKELVDDISNGKTMMRLLQGDVGSGKTVVSTAVAFHIVKQHSGQVAFLAPLEVLAQQHYASLSKMLLPLGVRCELLTGSLSQKNKEFIKARLRSGDIDIIIGTHAIIQDDIGFHDLQLAIVDEQHKFGVRQRSFFQRFGSPHLLQMTATPIPRSLTLAYFGEFDVSLIDEMPAGRKPIQTKIITASENKKLKPWILTKIAQGQKVFVITPLIEESEHLEEVASVLDEAEEVKSMYNSSIQKLVDSKTIPDSSFVTSSHSYAGDSTDGIHSHVGCLHGKLKPAEKDEIMKKFKMGEYKILVSTTVIEVGIDIPDATVIVIKNSERFGLSQLHQLRGRVGRSDLQSYCFLQTKRKSGDSYQRLKHMETTTDGFKLSEIDLQLRGAGQILGVRQSGETDIPLEILTDQTFLDDVQDAAVYLDKNHSELAKKIIESDAGVALV